MIDMISVLLCFSSFGFYNNKHDRKNTNYNQYIVNIVITQNKGNN